MQRETKLNKELNKMIEIKKIKVNDENNNIKIRFTNGKAVSIDCDIDNGDLTIDCHHLNIDKTKIKKNRSYGYSVIGEATEHVSGSTFYGDSITIFYDK